MQFLGILGLLLAGSTTRITDASITNIAAGIAMGLGALAAPIGIGMLTARAMEALGRNPEARAPIQTNMILAIAFCEAIAIYALLIAIVIKFV